MTENTDCDPCCVAMWLGDVKTTYLVFSVAKVLHAS